MKIIFYPGFYKRGDSTKLPSAEGAREYDWNPYQAIDIMHPAFRVPVTFSRWYYCYIPDYGRYYRLVNEVRDGAYKIMTFEEDCLGSTREVMAATTCLIERCSGTYNPDIIDPLSVVLPEVYQAQTFDSAPFMPAMGSNVGYIVQYSGAQGIHTVYLSERDFQTMQRALWVSWDSAAGSETLLKTIFNPADYIMSVQKCLLERAAWVYADLQNPHNRIPIVMGNLQLTDSGNIVYGWEIKEPQSASKFYRIPKHPQAGSYPWTKSAPYSTYSLMLPCCGTVELSANDLYGYDDIQVSYECEGITGKIRAQVTVGGQTADDPDPHVIAEIIGQGTVSYAIGTSTINPAATVAGFGSAIGLAATGHLLAAGGAAVGTAVGMMQSTLSVKGVPSGCVGASDVLRLIYKYQKVTDVDLANQGRPLMEVRQIKTLGGYIKCANAHINQGDMLTEEVAIVESFMNGGFRYE